MARSARLHSEARCRAIVVNPVAASKPVVSERLQRLRHATKATDTLTAINFV